MKFETDVKTSANVLVIPKVLASHAGTITIKASNTVGEVEHSFKLDVFEAPKISAKLENITVNDGQEAKFVVKVSGKPKPAFKWFKDDEEIVVNTEEDVYEFVETEESIQFIIKSVKPSNTGSYHVQLTNEAGQVSTNKAQLVVNSKSSDLNSS